MGEKEHRYVCSRCSIYIGLYGVFRVIRSCSGGYEGTGVRVRLAGCNARMRGAGVDMSWHRYWKCCKLSE